jgi:hypothetical protein
MRRRPVVTIALMPRRAHAIGRFARFSSAARDVVGNLPVRRSEPHQTINAGRWATLPGEYAGPQIPPLDRTLAPMTAVGTSAPVACAGHGPAIVHLGGIWQGHVVFEGSRDGAHWLPLPLISLDGDPDGSETDHPGLWRSVPDQPVHFFRLHVTHLSTGAVLAAIAAAPTVHHLAEQTLDSAA